MKVRERKEESQQAGKIGSGSFNVFFLYLEESEKAEIHAAATYSQRLLPMQQVPPLPLLCVIQ